MSKPEDSIFDHCGPICISSEIIAHCIQILCMLCSG